MRIAILGAECTGKSTLTQALQVLISKEHGTTQLIPEYLRIWCDEHGRTPDAHEQWHIARQQSDTMRNANKFCHSVSDTTALMTAIYSDIYFNDPSLYDFAVVAHRKFDCTLVMGLDLPWVADGLQRDSESMRQRCDATLRRKLSQYGISYTGIYGSNEERATFAYHSVLHLLGSPTPTTHSNWKWSCEKCSDADCEHTLFSKLVN